MTEEKKHEAEAAEEAAAVAEDEQVPEVEGEVVEESEAAEEAVEASEEAGEEDPCEAQPQENIFDAIKQEVTDLRDRYARLQAEWDNYRKRTAAERASERERASEGLATDLLPVLDDLERAIAHAKESGEGGTLTEGVEAIQTKFLQILGKHHVAQIEALGAPFDAMQHQAVGTREDESVPEETVVQVFQNGYTMGDRVIRPAMVITSTGGPQQAVEAEE